MPIGTTEGTKHAGHASTQAAAAPSVWKRPAALVLFLLGLVAAGYVGWRSYASPPPAAGSATLHCPPAPNEAGGPHPGMVWVPAGSFALGDSVYPEEQPVRATSVQGFWMDRTEVTNAQFAEFVQATGYVTVAERALEPATHPGLPPHMLLPGAVVFISPSKITQGGDVRQWWQYVPGAQWRHPSGPDSSIAGQEAFPVVAITIEDARAYAQWKKRSLPTEAEWEWAARGGQTAAPGNTEQPAQANTWQGLFPVSNRGSDGFEGLAPVGCFAGNGYGLRDMIGNAWELTADRYTEDHSARNNLAPDQAPPPQRSDTAVARQVIKGGSFLCAPNYCMRYRAAARQPQEDDLGTSHVGFRTILRAPGP